MAQLHSRICLATVFINQTGDPFDLFDPNQSTLNKAQNEGNNFTQDNRIFLKIFQLFTRFNIFQLLSAQL